MNDAAIVRVPEPLTNVARDRKNLSPIEAMSLPLHLKETVPFDQFHREKQHAIFLAITDQLDDVRMVQFQ